MIPVVLGIALALALWPMLRGGLNQQPAPQSPTTGANGTGPMVIYTGSGGLMSMPRKGSAPFSVTYGQLLLCTTEPGVRAYVDRVRRELLPADSTTMKVRTTFVRIPRGGTLTGGVIGGPEKVKGKQSGTLTEPVTRPCDRGVHVSGLPELLTTVTTTPEGGMVTRTFVDYHVGTERYTAVSDWRMGNCGTELVGKVEDDLCTRHDVENPVDR